MILYHYTSLFHLPGIVASKAIVKGDVPISLDKGFQAPWFTTNANPDKIKIPSNVCKTGARITVALSDQDTSLIKWTEVVTRWRVQPAFAESLHVTGGKDSDSWYIYYGTVDVRQWVAIQVLGEDNKYHTLSPKALAYDGNVPNFAMQLNMTEL